MAMEPAPRFLPARPRRPRGRAADVAGAAGELGPDVPRRAVPAELLLVHLPVDPRRGADELPEHRRPARRTALPPRARHPAAGAGGARWALPQKDSRRRVVRD